MKILILHGENQVDSRRRLRELIDHSIKKGLNIINIDGPNINKTDFLTIARSPSLLLGTDLLVVEGFFKNKKATEILNEVADRQNEISTSCLFWEDRTVPVSKIPKKSFIKSEKFDIPKLIFTLVDLVTPQTKKQAIRLFQDRKLRDNCDYFLIMLARQVKYMIWLKEDPDQASLPVWQKKKIQIQANKFTSKSLRKLHTDLLDLDYKSKSSGLTLNLESSLELLILSL